MPNNDKLRHYFQSHKYDVPDNGFTEDLMKQLPKRNAILPKIIIVSSIVLGFILTFAIGGISPFLHQIYELITSLNEMQLPSITSVSAYLISILLLGSVSYAIYQTEVV